MLDRPAPTKALTVREAAKSRILIAPAALDEWLKAHEVK